MLRIRAFRAIDDEATCELFAEGHKNVLLDYGITKVTTSNKSWFYNPGVYVVIIESEDGKTIFGGERIHIANDYAPLPLEDAIKVVDERVLNLVNEYKSYGTGELCGLWNSKYIAGRGLSQILTKVGVSLARQLALKSLFVLCAPYTVKMCQMAGFEIEDKIGKNGTFNYPKLDLVATALKIENLSDLSSADPKFLDDINSMVGKPNQNIIHVGESMVFDINLQLELKIINHNIYANK
ncbi:MAG: hypothetical protein V4538_15910 [Bacteroidota bacterium]